MENKQMTIEVNAIINDIESNKRYRILYIMSKDNLVLIEMDTSKFNVFVASMNELIRGLGTRYLLLKDENKIVDESKLTEKQKEKYLKRKNFVNQVSELYGPTYLDLLGHAKKDDLITLYQSYGYSRTYAWKLIKKILQNGFDYTTLLNKKTYSNNSLSTQKVGRKSIVD